MNIEIVKFDMLLTPMNVCEEKLKVLHLAAGGADNAGERYDYVNDCVEGEPFDEAKSGVGSITEGESLEKWLHSCRLYRYDGSDSYELTDEQKEEFEIYHDSYLDHLHSRELLLPAADFAARMVADLLWLDKTFGRIYTFESQVKDFLEHAGEREYQAMWMTLMEFAEDLQYGLPLQHESWSKTDAYERFLSPRWVIKDLLVIFANKALRELVFEVG